MAYSGKFYPKNPHKYKGDINNIVWRSTWERRLMKFLDENDNVLEYGSEEIVVPYYSPVDGRPHRYFVDFYVKLRDKNGDIKVYIVEVKPFSQTQPPKKRSKMTPAYMKECQTYAVNQAKWDAARKFAEHNGIEFIVLTEKQLFGK
jgi:hypothetical protein